MRRGGEGEGNHRGGLREGVRGWTVRLNELESGHSNVNVTGLRRERDWGTRTREMDKKMEDEQETREGEMNTCIERSCKRKIQMDR